MSSSRLDLGPSRTIERRRPARPTARSTARPTACPMRELRRRDGFYRGFKASLAQVDPSNPEVRSIALPELCFSTRLTGKLLFMVLFDPNMYGEDHRYGDGSKATLDSQMATLKGKLRPEKRDRVKNSELLPKLYSASGIDTRDPEKDRRLRDDIVSAIANTRLAIPSGQAQPEFPNIDNALNEIKKQRCSSTVRSVQRDEQLCRPEASPGRPPFPDSPEPPSWLDSQTLSDWQTLSNSSTFPESVPSGAAAELPELFPTGSLPANLFNQDQQDLDSFALYLEQGYYSPSYFDAF